MNSQMEGHHHPVGEAEEGQHQSVMKKVKAKARKIKDTITKHGHGHHHDHDHDAHQHHEVDMEEDSDEDEMEDHPELHGAPIYESKEVRSYVPGHLATSVQHDVMLAGAQPTPPVRRTDAVQPGEVKRDVMLAGAQPTPPVHRADALQPGVHGTAAATTPLALGHHRTKDDTGLTREAHNLKDHRGFVPEQVGVSKHDNEVTFGGSQTPQSLGGGPTSTFTQHPQRTGIPHNQTPLEPDPNSPGSGDRRPHNYQSKAKDPTGRGCEELGVTPILHSLDKMTIYDDDGGNVKHRNVKTSTGHHEGLFEPNAGLADKNRSQPLLSGAGSHDRFLPEPISHPPAQHADNVSSTTSVISDKAIQAKNAVASMLGYGGRHEDHEKTTNPSLAHERGVESEKTTSPSSVADYGKKVASTVHEKVAGAGGAIMSKMPVSQHEPEPEVLLYNKGVSTKECITEKVSPREEDKALSELISGALHMDRGNKDDLEDEKKAEPRGKVTFSANVARQLGGKEEAHPAVEDLGSGVSGPAGGKGMVDKMRDTATSWLGIGGNTDEPSSLVWHDIPNDEKEADKQDKDKGRGT